MLTIQDLLDYQTKNPKLVRADRLGDLLLLKYSKRTFIDKAWTPEVNEMRGTVINTVTGELVAYPFSKFFNVGEPFAPQVSEDEEFEAVEKRNGFLAIVTVYNGQLLYHTSGSLSGDYIKLIKDMIDEERFLSVLDPKYTYMFEVIHPNDYHVTEEEVGLHLLGFREKVLGSPIIHDKETLEALAQQLGVHTPKHYHGTLAELRVRLKDMDIEGFVLYGSDGKMLKLKGDRFLTKRFIAYMNDKKLDGLSEEYIAEAEEEFQPILAWILAHREEYKTYTHEERVMFVRRWFSQPIAFMMVGMPYSGKSTYVKSHAFLAELPQVSMDDAVEKLCAERNLTYNTGFNTVVKESDSNVRAFVNELIVERQTFVWDGTNLTKKSRAKKLNRLKAAGYTVVAIEMPTLPPYLEIGRILSRLDKVIEDPILERMRESYEHVRLDEGFDLVYAVEAQDLKD